MAVVAWQHLLEAKTKKRKEENVGNSSQKSNLLALRNTYQPKTNKNPLEKWTNYEEHFTGNTECSQYKR